jgi:hypothetical protein
MNQPFFEQFQSIGIIPVMEIDSSEHAAALGWR